MSNTARGVFRIRTHTPHKNTQKKNKNMCMLLYKGGVWHKASVLGIGGVGYACSEGVSGGDADGVPVGLNGEEWGQQW